MMFLPYNFARAIPTGGRFVNRKLKSSSIQVNRKAEFKQAVNTR
jgi:hypothetical protein